VTSKTIFSPSNSPKLLSLWMIHRQRESLRIRAVLFVGNSSDRRLRGVMKSRKLTIVSFFDFSTHVGGPP
jgi:hypothetical protein